MNKDIHNAASTGDIDAVRRCIKKKHEINFKDVADESPLHKAAEGGHIDVANALIQAGADLHAKNRDQDSPLHIAAEKGHHEVVKALIRAGADANAKNKYYYTPLHKASKGGHVEVINVLLMVKADVQYERKYHKTPLHYVANGGHNTIVESLIRAGAEVNVEDENQDSPLHYAAMAGHTDVVDTLIRAGADANTKNIYQNTPLHNAANGGCNDTVKTLLLAGSNLNDKNREQQTPLHQAVKYRNSDVAETLVNAGAVLNNTSYNGKTPLLLVRENGDVDNVQTLKSDANVDIRDRECIMQIQYNQQAEKYNRNISIKRGEDEIISFLSKQAQQSPVYLAAKCGHKAAFQLLIDAGADVKVIDVEEKALLLSATLNGDNDIIKTLIKAGADVDIRDQNGKVPLHIATEKGDIDILKTLIKAGADVNVKDLAQQSPVHLAAKYGRKAVFKLFIDAGADVKVTDEIGMAPLHIATKRGDIDIVKTLIKAGADVDVNDLAKQSPVHLAAKYGRKAVFQLLIDAGADVKVTDEFQQYPVQYAVIGGQNDILKTIVECGMDVNIKDQDDSTLLHCAAERGYVDVVRTLIQAAAEINVMDSNRQYPVQRAVYGGHSDVVKLLIENGVDVNITDENKRSLLHRAAARGHVHVINALLKAGADINVRDSNGTTSLHLSAEKGHIEVVKALVESGADVDRKDLHQKGKTSLHLAAEKGHIEVVKTLIEVGADVNRKDLNDKTSLHLAAEKGHIEVVKTLIEVGADVYKKDLDGKTAKQLANSRIRKVFQEFENATKRVPKEIRMLGPSATARYLSALEKDSAVSNVIRVMLVGHFGVGKTTLAMALLEKRVKRIDSTDGIEVYISQCMYDRRAKKWHTDRKYNETLLGFDEVIRLDFVDFAGQLIFYTTHQTYLTSRGLYLLVFNLAMGLTKEVCDEDVHLGKSYRRVIDFLEYWIVTIKTYARGEQDDFPKIILVGTHKDKITEEKDLRQIKDEIVAKFHDMVISAQLVVRDDLFISATNMSNETRKSIRDIILEEGRKYQEFGERIPAPWIALQERLMKLKEEGQYIVTIGQIRKINSELNAPLDDEELDIFLKYLHNIGYILYFSTSLLNERIILDPKVVIDAMRCFITCERFVKRVSVRKIWNHMRVFGEVKKSHILKMWKGKGLAVHSEHLLAIMKKLDLICEPMIYGRGEQLSTDFFVVPSMIKAVKPDVSVVGFPRHERVELVFSSETLLPPAIFNRLVCSCLALWTIYDKHLYDELVVLKSGRYHLIQMKRDMNQIIITFAHTEQSKRPEIQLCLAVKQFLVETIDRIVAVYSTSLDGPISCNASSFNAFLDDSQKATGSHGDKRDTDPDARETIACRCDAYVSCNLKDVNLMRIAVQLQRVDLSAICTALLNDAEFAKEIENNHQGVDMDVKAFYVLQEWKQQTENFSGTELRNLFENHLENVNIHICKAIAEEVLNPGIIDPTILVSKVYPKYLDAVADKISKKYLHLGLELDLTLEEIERLRMEKSTILEVVRAMLGQWYHHQKEDATVSRLPNALFRCGVNKLKWLEEFETEQIIQREKAIYSESKGGKCSMC